MIDSISCKRFRRFENLDPIKLSDVNLFYGDNNTGKSTVIKAILLLKENLLNETLGIDPEKRLPLFNLSTQYANIFDFRRALHKNASQQTIELSYELDGTTFRIELGESFVDANACIEHIEIENDLCKLYADFKNDLFGYRIGKVSNRLSDFDYQSFNTMICDYYNLQNSLSELNDQNKQYHKQLRDKQRKDKSQIVNNITEIRQKIEDVNRSINETKEKLRPLFDKIHSVPRDEQYMENEYECDWLGFMDVDANGSHCPIFLKLQDILSSDLSAIYDIFRMEYNSLHFDYRAIYDPFAFTKIIYLNARNVQQKPFFLTSYKNDSVAKEIYWRKINYNPSRYGVEKNADEWLRKFGIGESIIINTLPGGEAYTVDIKTFEGTVVPLQDFETGAIQIVSLLLRTLSIDNRFLHNNGEKDILIIEEPEQNIHPKWHSVLAEYISGLSSWKDLQVIVETHSEKMVEYFQSLVASDKRGYVSYSIYHFPSEGQPYDITSPSTPHTGH